MNKKIIFFICVLFLLVACKNKVSEDDAIRITQEFVNSQVKFYVNEDQTSKVVSRANIIIQDTELIDDTWKISLQIRSNNTGEWKKSDLIVTLDADTGEVLKMDKPIN